MLLRKRTEHTFPTVVIAGIVVEEGLRRARGADRPPQLARERLRLVVVGGVVVGGGGVGGGGVSGGGVAGGELSAESRNEISIRRSSSKARSAISAVR